MQESFQLAIRLFHIGDVLNDASGSSMQIFYLARRTFSYCRKAHAPLQCRSIVGQACKLHDMVRIACVTMMCRQNLKATTLMSSKR